MIAKVVRGQNVERLIWYLYGPGRREEHTDPHLVAAWTDPAAVEPGRHSDGRRDFRSLTGLLRQPHAALGDRGFAEPVWHCSVRAAGRDRTLSDAEWAQIAADVMHRTGLAPEGDDEAVRWVAVRHGDDHIHIVAMLARQDGTRPRFWGDFWKLGQACHAAEARYGLQRTAPRDGTAARRPTRGENEKARRAGRAEAPRVTLRRAVHEAAATSCGQEEFLARLTVAGIQVRLRHSQRDPGQVTGYAVALTADTTRDGTPVWYGGGKLAADLTLPALRRRWADAIPAAEGLTGAERAAIWAQVTTTAAHASDRIRDHAAARPGDAQDAAWAAADMLHAAASALGSPAVRQAAAAFDRASRAPYRRLPPRTRGGDQLRRAGRLISAAGRVSGDTSLRHAALLVRLAALADSVAELRAVQGRQAQAAAARAAAIRLRHAAPTRPPRGPRPARAAARLAAASFPRGPRTAGPVPEPLVVPAPAPRTSPARGPSQPRAGPGP